MEKFLEMQEEWDHFLECYKLSYVFGENKVKGKPWNDGASTDVVLVCAINLNKIARYLQLLTKSPMMMHVFNLATIIGLHSSDMNKYLLNVACILNLGWVQRIMFYTGQRLLNPSFWIPNSWTLINQKFIYVIMIMRPRWHWMITDKIVFFRNIWNFKFETACLWPGLSSFSYW